jgi:hypothetical protein
MRSLLHVIIFYSVQVLMCKVALKYDMMITFIKMFLVLTISELVYKCN